MIRCITIAGALAGAALAVAAVTTMPVAAADFTFKLHHFLSPKAPAHTRMLAPWAAAVERNAGGRVTIELYPSMTLGGRPPELIQQARDGVVDIVWTVNGYTAGLFPRTEVAELPFLLTNDPRPFNLALYDIFDSDLKPEYAGVEVMFLHVHAGQGIHMRTRPVQRLEDLAGLKLRIPTRTGAWVIEALGATPVGMPVPDLPQALQKGVIDGALIPWEIIPPLKIQDQTAYQIEGHNGARLGNTTFQVSMNKGRWDSLPADIQQAFRDASGRDWWGMVGDIWRASEEVGISLAVKAGNTHTIMTEAETDRMRTAMAPVIQRWINEVGKKGIDGAALVARIQALIADNDES